MLIATNTPRTIPEFLIVCSVDVNFLKKKVAAKNKVPAINAIPGGPNTKAIPGLGKIPAVAKVTTLMQIATIKGMRKSFLKNGIAIKKMERGIAKY